MPKVLRILNRFNLGGPTYNAVYLTKYLAPEYQTLLIGGEKEESEESSLFIAEQEGLSPLVIPEMKRSINPFQDRKALNRIKAIIQDFKPDIVHTHASKAGLLGRKAAFACNVPIVVHTFHGHVFHSYFNPVKTKIIKAIERNLARKTSAIVAISEVQKDELVNIHHICPDSKMTVIPLGFDLTKYTLNQEEKRKQFRDKYKVADDEIVITIVGRLVAVKNHSFFIQTVQKVLNSVTQKTRFFIVGDGDQRAVILEMLQKANISHTYWPEKNEVASVTLTSWHKDVDVVNAGSDIIVLTSLNEGTPVSLIEAQAAGKPIVSTRVGGIDNIVLENKSAFLTGVSDIELFSKQLINLIEQDHLRKEMSNAGRDFVLRKYSHEVLCQNMSQLYHKLLAEKGFV